jgi:hypothetical protein
MCLPKGGRFSNVLEAIDNIRYFHGTEKDKAFREWARLGNFYETPCGHFKYDAHSRFAQMLGDYVEEYNLIHG